MRGQFSSPRPGFFLSHRILAVQTSRLRSLRRYFQSTGHRGTARKLERKPRSVLADARPASPSLPPEGSETWLTGTLPPPPATPPLPLPSSSWWRFHPDGSRWTIVRSSPQRKEKRVPATLSPSLSLSLPLSLSSRFDSRTRGKSVYHRGRNEITERGPNQGKTKSRRPGRVAREKKFSSFPSRRSDRISSKHQRSAPTYVYATKVFLFPSPPSSR